MSYLVLARKWRPALFADLVGQSHVARTLETAIARGRVAHAFLFTGTRGVGKTTTARILAMALNCEKGPSGSPCGACHSCREIKNGVGLDVMEIDGASNRGIDEIRSLRETIAYTPAGGKYRIVIIDEVHMLTKEAFNALLKSLEEPPPNFIFIFATTEPHKVPETILSRVQRYDFKRIAPPDIFGRLKHICGEEKLAAEEEALWIIARKANGSMRDALTLLDQVIPFCSGKISAAEVRGVLGLAGAGAYRDLFNAVQAGDEAACMRIVAGVFAQGADLSEFVLGMEEHLRHLLLSRIPGIDPDAVNLPAGEIASFREQAGAFQAMDLLRMLEIVSQLGFRMSRSAMPRFELEAALMKLANMDASVDIAALLSGTPPARDEAPKKKMTGALPEPPASGGPPSPATEAPPREEIPPPPPARELNFTELKEKWRTHLSAIMDDNMRVGTFLSFSFILSADEAEIRIGVPRSHQFQYQQLIKPDHLRYLMDFFRNRCGYAGRIAVEAVEDEKSRIHLGAERGEALKSAESAPPKTERNINEAVRKEPILGALLDVFNGEVR